MYPFSLPLHTIKDIIANCLSIHQAVVDEVGFLEIEQRNFRPDGKWSIAENLDHLVLSGSPVVSALQLPKVVLEEKFGFFTGSHRSFESLRATYLEVLATGVKAPARFVPAAIDTTELLPTFQALGNNLAKFTEEHWNEETLDQYALKHPVLGLLSMREMLFFTLFHTDHHYQAIMRIKSSLSGVS